MTICRLCEIKLTDDNRCDAHIFPSSLLKTFSPNEYGQLLLVGTEMSKKRAPIGSYDNQILCRDCDDNILGKYDDYIVRFVKNEKFNDIPGVGWTASGFDQHKLKMFFLSYIWRSSITKRPEFNGVKLGQKHETAIRNMLLKGDSGDIHNYSVVVSKFISNKTQSGGLLLPAKTRIKGIIYYEGYLPRMYKFWIKVDSQSDSELDKVSLGGLQDILIFSRGDFDSSIEKSIMRKAVAYSDKKSGSKT